MQLFNKLLVKNNKKILNIDFEIPDNSEELEKRFEIYSKKKYIEPSRFPDHLEKDEYDFNNKSIYFIAKINDQIIGTMRLIKDIILPTQIYFEFEEPPEIAKISPSNRIEIGRLISAPYALSNKIHLPQHIIMLMLFKTAADYALKNNYLGGYAFIKSKLEKKLSKLRIPFHRIESYIQKYPSNGILFNYFNDPDDPVLPVYYLTNEFHYYIEKILNNILLFKKISKTEFYLRSNFIYNFIMKYKILN